MVGGAAAALTGLVLVAISLHMRAILGHPFYRDRSFTTLQALVTILVLAGAALVPQPINAFGVEVFVLGIYWIIRLFRFIQLYRRASGRASRSERRFLWRWEWLTWTMWDAALIGSGVLLWSSDERGLYGLAAMTITGFTLIVWNVWVLISEVSG